MLQTLLSLTLALFATTPATQPAQEGDAGGAPAESRDPEAIALLEAAAKAARELRSASYSIQSTVSRGRGPQSTANGQVSFEVIAIEDGAAATEPIGARLAIRGEATQVGPEARDVSFKIAYDGALVRARFGAERVVYESAIDADGLEMLAIGEQLMMEQLHSHDPFALALKAPLLAVDAEETMVGDHACRRVRVEHGPEGRSAKYEWFFSVADHLPRRRVAELHRRGVYQVEVLELSKLIANPEIYGAVFKLPSPADIEVRPYVSERPRRPDVLAVGSAAPDFALLDPDGKSHRLADYEGRVLVLDFWATWSPPCYQTMPMLQRLHERFADNARVAIVGVSTSERGGDPAQFMRESGYTYGLLLNGESVIPEYGARYLPTLYVIGPNGSVLYAGLGLDVAVEAKLGELIEGALE